MMLRAEALGIADGLHLVGSLDLDLLGELLASSDAVLAAHMGYTLVEAGLTGVPIVTYDYDWHPEILEDGVSGYLAPLGDTQALADRLCDVLANPVEARAVGARARERLLAEHSLDSVIPLYRSAFDAILRRR
jgi:glycosyltransferase involved in cell wall biosynthesis